MATAVQLRRGSTGQISSFTGLLGECVVNTTTKTLVVNDGETAGGIPLARADFDNISASATLTLGTLSATQVDITAQGDLRLQDTTGGEYAALQAPGTVSASYTLTMPSAVGASGQALRASDGSGALEWYTPADVGDITSVVAGAGLTGGGTSGAVTLNAIGTADRVSVSADAIDIASTYAGQATITTVGTIASGTWQGTAIANAYLANSTVNYGGVSLALGASDTTPAFNLSDATAYPGDSSLVTTGTITSGAWQGTAIANAYLANSTVNFGGVTVALGASDTTPAFNLSDATAYPGDSSLVTTGTIASGTWQGTAIAKTYVAGSPAGDYVGTSDSQTLTNKTLTTPVIGTISNTGTLTLPTSTDTLVGRATTDTLTNKTLTSPVLNGSLSGTAFLDENDLVSNSQVAAASQASIKTYVDSVASGLDLLDSVHVASTAALTVTYSNGSSGVGATLTNAGTQAALVIDGQTLVATERVLIKDQAAALQNGIYTVTNVGSGSANWVLTRSTDFDTGAEMDSGSFVFVETGTTNADSGWVMTTDGPITVGSTALDFTQFSKAADILAGDGLTKTGSTIDAIGTSNRISVNGNIDIDAAYVGQASITTLGTIGSGIWQGTAIADTYVTDALTISGGTINNTVIGGSTAAAISATTLTGNDTSLTGSSSGSTVLTLTSNALADTPLMVFQRTGGAVAGKLAYEDTNTAMSFGTTTAHELKLLTNNINRLEIDSSGNATFAGSVSVGNITVDTNTISSTNSNGNIIISPNGTGNVNVFTDVMAIQGSEGEGPSLALQSDDSDDAGDEWRFTSNTDQTLSIKNNISGSEVDYITLTPHATVASSTATFAGKVGIGAPSPGSTLDILTAANTTPLNIKAATDGYNYSTIENAAGDDVGYFGLGAALVTSGSADDFAVRAQQNDLVFLTGGANERLRIDDAGLINAGPFGGAGTAIIAGSSSPGYTNQPGTNLHLKSGDGSGTGSSEMKFFTSPAGSSGTTVNTAIVALTIDSSQKATFGGAIQVNGTTGIYNGLSGDVGGISISPSNTNTIISNNSPGSYGDYGMLFRTMKTTGGAAYVDALTLNYDGKATFENDLTIQKSTGSTLVLRRSDADIVDGENLGSIAFRGNDPSDSAGALIQARATGTWASNNYPTSILFYTDNGSGDLTERFRIANDGSLSTLTLGTSNTRFGVNAGNSIVSGGNYNVLVGDGAGTELTTGDENIAIGYAALDALQTGGQNVAIGAHALGQEVSGLYNTAIGREALKTQNGANNNTAVGRTAGMLISTGAENCFMGSQAGDATSTGSYNTGIGFKALSANEADTHSTALGHTALQNSNGGHSNTASGNNALGSLTTGTGNNGFGRDAGDNIVDGIGNTCIGQNSNTSASNGEYQIVIGHDFAGNGDNKVNLGSSSGYVWNSYTVNNTWTQVSDERTKKNIESDDLGLEFINKLRPVTFNWKHSTEIDPEFIEDTVNIGRGEKDTETLIHGLIAQEVKAAMDEVGNDTFNGWEEGQDGQAISREMFVTPLIRAVQELSNQITALQAEVTKLKGE